MLERETPIEARSGLVILFKYKSQIYLIPTPKESLHKSERAIIKTSIRKGGSNGFSRSEQNQTTSIMSGNLNETKFEFIGGGVKSGFPLAYTLVREVAEELGSDSDGEREKMVKQFINSLDLGSIKYKWVEQMEVDQQKGGRRRYFPMVHTATVELNDQQFAMLKIIQPKLHALDITRPKLYRPFVQLMIQQQLFDRIQLVSN